MKIIFISALLLISCGHKQHDVFLTKVKINYVPEYATAQYPIHCLVMEEELSQMLKQKTVNNKRFLKLISDKLAQLEKWDEDLIVGEPDIRIKLYLEYPNKVDTLCLGDFFDIVYNGKRMKDNKDILKLVKDRIY